MFEWLYNLLGIVLSFLSINGYYALGLLFYALIFKIIFLPFSIKQQKNQIKMAKLAPKIEVIKAKYKGRTDQVSMQKQQEEIQALQQKEGYNALSGCLPMLIQLPIIMLLYAVIQSPLSYIAKETDEIKEYNERYTDSSYVVDTKILEFYGDDIYEKNSDGSIKYDDANNPVRVAIDPIAKLYEHYGVSSEAKSSEITLIGKILADGESNKDVVEHIGIDYESIPKFTVLGINLAETPNIMAPSWIIVIPFLAAVASWLSMFLTRKINPTPTTAPTDAQTKKSMGLMDLVMPLMTLFIAFSFSAMLGLYWIYQSLLGLLQTFIIAKIMPIPKYTEEELREMRRQQKEAEKEARSAAKVTRHRSLHYIDEDDYDELPEAQVSEESKKKGTKLGGGDVPEIKD